MVWGSVFCLTLLDLPLPSVCVTLPSLFQPCGVTLFGGRGEYSFLHLCLYLPNITNGNSYPVSTTVVLEQVLGFFSILNWFHAFLLQKNWPRVRKKNG